MSEKKLFIHIGTQKTGTTTIQSILSKNNKKLLKEGICYLGRFAELAREIRVIKKPDSVLANKLREQVNARLTASRNKDAQTYVISNEKFSGEKMDSYRNAEAIARLLKETFEAFSFDIKIIVFLRRQDEYIESTYAQRIYSGSSLSFNEFMEHFDENDFHWNDFVNRYAEVFGKENILVHPFDRKYLPKKESLIQTIGEDIGSTFLQNYSGKIVKNKSFSRGALEISRITNQYLNKQEMRQFRDILKNSDLDGRKCIFFSSKERVNFLKIYEKSNHEVAAHYLNTSDDELFSSPKNLENNSDHEYEELTAESVAVLLSQVILDLNRDLKEKISEKKKKNMWEKGASSIYRLLKRTYRNLKI